MDQLQVVDLLKRLGWIAAELAPQITPPVVSAAIAAFQAFHGLDQTGDLSPATERTLGERVYRGCGCPDIQRATLEGRLCRWPTGRVAYYIARTPGGVDPDAARQCYRNAWNSWRAVSGLDPFEVDTAEAAQVVMDVGRGSRNGFDGPNGTLAWSELPCGAQQVLQRYDLAEDWATAAPAAGRILLENVACHEIGHAIGLDHIAPQRGRALMNPIYSASVPKPLALDAADAVMRYGQPAAAPAPPVGPTPPTPPTPTGPPATKRKITIEIEGLFAGDLVAAVKGLRA